MPEVLLLDHSRTQVCPSPHPTTHWALSLSSRSVSSNIHPVVWESISAPSSLIPCVLSCHVLSSCLPACSQAIHLTPFLIHPHSPKFLFLEGHLAKSGELFWSSWSVERATGLLWIEVRDAVSHPKMSRTVPTTVVPHPALNINMCWGLESFFQSKPPSCCLDKLRELSASLPVSVLSLGPFSTKIPK